VCPDRLRRAPAARVVNVSSLAHLFYELNFGPKRFLDDINFKQNYDRFTPYNVSKLCNILFTRELQRRFAGTSRWLSVCGRMRHCTYVCLQK
jgi:NAD(P)-dependent dehydrogenase (short-subunit alcohol dehydrogenase family)